MLTFFIQQPQSSSLFEKATKPGMPITNFNMQDMLNGNIRVNSHDAPLVSSPPAPTPSR